jgi:hypothetical protein
LGLERLAQDSLSSLRDTGQSESRNGDDTRERRGSSLPIEEMCKNEQSAVLAQKEIRDLCFGKNEIQLEHGEHINSDKRIGLVTQQHQHPIVRPRENKSNTNKVHGDRRKLFSSTTFHLTAGKIARPSSEWIYSAVTSSTSTTNKKKISFFPLDAYIFF